eukprot:3271364-Amphidinium_carterae.1
MSRHCSNSPTQHQRRPHGERLANSEAGPSKRPPKARLGDLSPPGEVSPSSERSGVSNSP